MMIRRLSLITPAMLRGFGITPAVIPDLDSANARLMAGIKLSYAAMLKKDINRNRRKLSFIGSFNCSRSDGSIIVKGCSVDVWEPESGTC